MIDWNSPQVIASNTEIFVQLVSASIGIYVFEWITSMGFDWSFVTRKRVFHWPMTVYFLNRYLMLGTCIAVGLSQVITSEINCQALFIFIQLAGTMSIGLASFTFAFRTMAVWLQNKFVVVPLILLMLGQWALIFQGILVHTTWIPGSGCEVVQLKTSMLSAQFVYTSCLDLIVLLLAGYQLVLPRSTRTKLGTALFRDGLIYFFVALIGNIVVAIFQLLDLNRIMNVMFNLPVFSLSTIAATRAVRNLVEYKNPGSELFTTAPTPVDSSHLAFQPSPEDTLRTTADCPIQNNTPVKEESFLVLSEERDVEAVGEG